VGSIDRLLLKHPREAFVNQDVADAQWKDLNYLSRPEYPSVAREYEYFVSILKKYIHHIYYCPFKKETGLDSIYIHDPVIMTPAGAILCNMGKELRKNEPPAAGEYLKKLDIPIIGSITGNGHVEGGDVVIFDERTIAIAHGYRTNSEGIRQFRELTADFVRELVVVPLPHWNGPADILHLMSIISPIDIDLAVVYSRLMPISFRQWLIHRGFRLIEVPDSEYDSMACNILAISPRICVMLEGNPATKSKLQAEGVKVEEFPGNDLCIKGGGGPTCLTRPLLRID
jgi:arginine deiminase